MAEPIHLWRIAKETAQYPAADLSGGGAKLTGGRWNPKGQPAVYAAGSIALATLETLAHLGDDIACRNRFLVELTVPPAVWKRREIATPGTLPATWLAEPAGLGSIQFGEEWLRSNRGALLAVPSVMIPEEFNILLNPQHPDIRKIQARVLRQFLYDPRL